MATEEYELFGLAETPVLNRKFSLRRSHLEVRMDILSCIKAGFEKPTQVMYKANLSWTALKEHLQVLEQGKLLAVVEYGTRRRYELTDKARAVLMAYAKLVEDVNAPIQTKATTTF